MDARPSATVATVAAEIERAVWLRPGEVRTSRECRRSPLVLRCVENYLAGRRYALDILSQHA